jgi:hypothetical protein
MSDFEERDAPVSCNELGMHQGCEDGYRTHRAVERPGGGTLEARISRVMGDQISWFTTMVEREYEREYVE